MEEEAQRLYDLILQTANHFLHNCKHFRVEVLAEEQPTYEEVALLARKVGDLVRVLAADFDPWMGQKSFEYCELMAGMGLAIRNQDQVLLSKLVSELERKPFL